MKREEPMEVVRGTGNVFRDLGSKNPDADQFKAILATEIIKALDRERLTVRQANARTGIAAADFSRIRNADLDRFTVDRLMGILNRLGSRIEVKVRVRRERAVVLPAPAAATIQPMLFVPAAPTIPVAGSTLAIAPAASASAGTFARS